MNGAVIIRMDAAGRKQGHTSAQPYAGGTAQIKFGSTRVACTASQKAGYRIRVGKRAGDRQCRFPLKGDPAFSGKNLPAIHSQSATSFLSRGVIPAGSSPDRRIAGGLLPIWRGLRLFESFPALMTAGRHVLSGLRIAIHLRQKSFRGCAQAFHFYPFLPAPTGLVAAVERHDSSERKIPNGGNSGARPGNLTARDGNA